MIEKIKKIGKFLLVAVILGIIFSLGKYFLIWNKVEIDNHLSKKILFKDFNHQKQQYIDGGDSEEIKTNNFRTKIDSLSTESYSSNISNNNFSLEIKLLKGDGFSGGGYSINIINNRYKISSYHYTDNHRPFDFMNEEYYKIIDSKVILDKDSYKKGDSIFGYTQLKVQKRYGPEKYFEEGEGYFKGIVN
ncbi:MAG: hypothetical protein K0R36_3476 [Chryseobacterium sp.]|jgi:hypothetical protein|uniref:hypothetical protein n=1 Tax=Chryseobacterium sp. TaxID=1871047 RepID=UPI0026391479|nr:hypothetical protein [Chryseobacterium sp.]MDF2554022.1 hypothetical protein [Chryseobacterium sp.]MDF2934145.1 hypothetical protein [Chryseobacterium sp.]